MSSENPRDFKETNELDRKRHFLTESDGAITVTRLAIVMNFTDTTVADVATVMEVTDTTVADAPQLWKSRTQLWATRHSYGRDEPRPQE